MSTTKWLREEADERLEGLFSEEPQILLKTIHDLLQRGAFDPEIEELLIDTLQRSLSEQNDETMGSAWMAVILGELASRDAVGTLNQALASDDETLVAAAVRALRRIGNPAFEILLERMDEDDAMETPIFVAIVQVLEGVALHDLPDTRERVELLLLRRLRRPFTEASESRQVEAAALALARLGAGRAQEVIEHLLDHRFDGNNSFLQEALEILAEQPEGLPCAAASPWQEEFRWAIGPELPGGVIEDPDEADDEEEDEERAPRRRY